MRGYNWPEIESKAKKKLEDIYDKTQSLRLTGEFFGKYAGVYMLTANTVKAELLRRGVKLRGKGGNHWKDKKKADEYIAKIKKIKGYTFMKMGQILDKTGLKIWQYQYAMRTMKNGI